MTVNNTIPLDEFLTENYLTYGKFVNFHRVIPGEDGLKNVHRRILMGLHQVADGKLISSVKAKGAISSLHPFGEISLETSMADMVRIGATSGEGSFGLKLIENIPAAAVRYTQCGLSKEQSDYNFRLSSYAPLVEGEVDMEPKYLIIPVPHALVYGALNWGLGIMGRTPAFTYKSLVEAYEANDPSKLVSNYGYIIDQKSSDLKSLWDNGTGRLALKYTVSRVNPNEILMIGSGEIFTPNIQAFDELVKTGQVIITNESTDKVVIRIAKAYRSRVDMDEVYKIALMAGFKSRSYNTLAVINDQIRTISLKEWIHLTISRYKETFEISRRDRIAKAKHNIEVLSMLPAVAVQLMANKTDAEILKLVPGLTEEIYSSIRKKPLSSLRRTDFQPEIDSLNKQIIEIGKEDVTKLIHSYMV